MVVEHHLEGQDAFFSGERAGQQVLADNRPEAERELRPNFPLDILREEVRVARDRALGVAGVQGGEDEVPGLSHAEGHLGRVAVADLADENDVGVLPQPVFQTVGEGVHVEADLALGDDRMGQFGKQVFDRLLDRDDPVAAFSIEEVDDHRQRGSFARAGDAGDEHQPVAEAGQALGKRFGKLGPLEVGDRRGNHAKAGAHPLAAEKIVDAEPLAPATDGYLQREVGVHVCQEAVHGLHRAERREQIADRIPVERLRRKFVQLPVQAEDGGVAGDDMQVRGAPLDGSGQPAANRIGTDRVGLSNAHRKWQHAPRTFRLPDILPGVRRLRKPRGQYS